MFKRALFLLMVVCLLAGNVWAAGQTMSIQVREASMRNAPSFTATPIATLAYGQTVSVLEERGAWMHVTGTGKNGWLHQSALSSRQLNLSSGGQDAASGASEREVSMAGKGFNAQTEQQYRQGHPSGYTQVEEMLKINYSSKDLYLFLNAGKLTPSQEVNR